MGIKHYFSHRLTFGNMIEFFCICGMARYQATHWNRAPQPHPFLCGSADATRQLTRESGVRLADRTLSTCPEGTCIVPGLTWIGCTDMAAFCILGPGL
jgi:hypothetical protein